MLYGCETWSLALKGEFRLRIIENRILRWIFGPKRDEYGEWRRLHNEKLDSFYCSPNKDTVINSRWIRWVGHLARMEGDRSSFKILRGKPTGKKTLRRFRHRRKDNIWMGLTEHNLTYSIQNSTNMLENAKYRVTFILHQLFHIKLPNFFFKFVK